VSSSDATNGLAATVAANIRSARVDAGLTQRELVAAVGLKDAMAVSRWERGEHRPNLENLSALAEVFGCDVSWFFADHQREAA
jgi:transcriptional regulator with XRE-family HTH domain